MTRGVWVSTVSLVSSSTVSLDSTDNRVNLANTVSLENPDSPATEAQAPTKWVKEVSFPQLMKLWLPTGIVPRRMKCISCVQTPWTFFLPVAEDAFLAERDEVEMALCSHVCLIVIVVQDRPPDSETPPPDLFPHPP